VSARCTFGEFSDSWARRIHAWHLWQTMPPPGSIVTGPAANRMARVAFGPEPPPGDFKRDAALLMVDNFLRQRRIARARKMRRRQVRP
jgi:hypothetical protein